MGAGRLAKLTRGGYFSSFHETARNRRHQFSPRRGPPDAHAHGRLDALSIPRGGPRGVAARDLVGERRPRSGGVSVQPEGGLAASTARPAALGQGPSPRSALPRSALRASQARSLPRDVSFGLALALDAAPSRPPTLGGAHHRRRGGRSLRALRQDAPLDDRRGRCDAHASGLSHSRSEADRDAHPVEPGAAAAQCDLALSIRRRSLPQRRGPWAACSSSRPRFAIETSTA